jgi:hypothetical protein
MIGTAMKAARKALLRILVQSSTGALRTWWLQVAHTIGGAWAGQTIVGFAFPPT